MKMRVKFQWCKSNPSINIITKILLIISLLLFLLVFVCNIYKLITGERLIPYVTALEIMIVAFILSNIDINIIKNEETEGESN